MHKERHFRNSILIFLCFFTTLQLYAGIEGAEPIYDYHEFLRDNLSYYFLDTKEPPVDERTLYSEFLQGYYSDHYHYSGLTLQDSTFSANLFLNYRDRVNQGSLRINYLTDHDLSMNYYDWEHKNNLGLIKINLKNSVTLHSKADRLLTWHSTLGYRFHHDRDQGIDGDTLSEFSVAGNITLFKEQWALEGGYALPEIHEGEHYRIYATFYKVWNSFMFGAGISQINDEESRLFPIMVTRFNQENLFVAALRLEEMLVEYPFEKHFAGNALLWKSTLPEEKRLLLPYRTRSLNFRAEFLTRKILHRLTLDYRTSDRVHDFDWVREEYDNPLFSIGLKEKSYESLSVSYSLQYKRTNIEMIYYPLDRLDLDPSFVAGFSQSFNYNVFNTMLLNVDYNHDVQPPVIDDVAIDIKDYITAGVEYSYSKFRNLNITAGFIYSTSNLKDSYFDIGPEIYIRIGYGRKADESLYR